MGHMTSTVRPLPTMTIVWHFKTTILCMLFHGLIKCPFACQKVYHTILYTQYNVMHVHCSTQLGASHDQWDSSVHGIFCYH
jgi:hypothetical protein